ncbi:MAG: 2Fe-2S iron-sulfur cluster binding domain-containing protein [Hyphomicrobiales bacterium]|nr:2Fe-2S iron-sulfur cluster binding domain-containing protein [Hyphomicrobiales bacterium]
MKITLQTKSGQYEYDCAPGETILCAGLRHGITLPYECATGTCGTCRGRVMEGDAVMGWEEAPGAARLKREKGDCLMCQTVVSSDALVRVASQNVFGEFPKGHVPVHCNGTIANCRKLTRDVMHFDVMIDQSMSFDAGQFVTLAVAGVTGPRAYSMVNYDQATGRLTFVVKRLPGGAFSDWLFETEVAGAMLKVFGPLGAATFYPDEGKNIICIGGGSGIAGMMSIIDRACQENYFKNHKGYVFFGVRTLKDCFYMAELSGFAASAGSNLDVTVSLSDEDPGLAAHPEFDNLKLDTGFVHEAASRAMTGKFDNMVGYVAGPPPMVDAALRVLIAEGKLPPADIRYDKFS